MKRLAAFIVGAVLASLVPTWLAAQTTEPATQPATRPATSRPRAAPQPKLPTDQPAARTTATGVPDNGWMRRHNNLVSLAKQGNIDVYFEGDSITDFWTSRASHGNPQGGRDIWNMYYAPLHAANFGISADRIEHVLYRLVNGEFEGLHPKVVVMMIGTNNFGRGPDTTPEEVATGVKKLIDTIQEKSPETKVLLLGIFPRANKATDPFRARIKAANELLAKFDNGTTIKFLDFGDKFLTDDGTLGRDIMPDYLHPNDKGYRIWANAMNPVLFPMLGLPVPPPLPLTGDLPTPATAPATAPAQ